MPKLGVEDQASRAAPSMHHYDTILSLDFEPRFFIDVSDVMERSKDFARIRESHDGLTTCLRIAECLPNKGEEIGR